MEQLDVDQLTQQVERHRLPQLLHCYHPEQLGLTPACDFYYG